jgi:tRNA C32,U32 (ribose-2'-O)-methylase TrmJ
LCGSYEPLQTAVQHDPRLRHLVGWNGDVVQGLLENAEAIVEDLKASMATSARARVRALRSSYETKRTACDRWAQYQFALAWGEEETAGLV